MIPLTFQPETSLSKGGARFVGEFLALAERQVQHVADHRALIHVIAEERVFAIQIVVVLDRASNHWRRFAQMVWPPGSR